MPKPTSKYTKEWKLLASPQRGHNNLGNIYGAVDNPKANTLKLKYLYTPF
jgi:hypothetical protein